MLNKLIKYYVVAVIAFGCTAEKARAQFTLAGQVRVRTEIRNGLGNLVPKDSKAAAFTSQRTRLAFGYKWDRVTMGVTLQDVRVWGQDASSISAADGSRLMLHEGWADIVLYNKTDSAIKSKGPDLVSLKIGRQELVYDDSRLLGNLDWLQQARRHDMALLKTMHNGWQADIGFAFNQNTDAMGITGTGYLPANVPSYVKNSLGILVPVPAGVLPLAPSGNPSNNSTKTGSPVWLNPPSTNGGNQDYKTFTSVYISRKFKPLRFSGLFFNDNFGKYKIDSAGSSSDGYVYGKRFISAGAADPFNYSGTHARYTYGVMVNTTPVVLNGVGTIAVQAACYAQSGKNRDGVKIANAFHYTASLSFQKGNLNITPGYDVLSGNDLSTATDEKFDPLYGTPHKFWGYMDYFYAGTGSPAGGLRNAYLKFKYAFNALSAGTDLHFFNLDKDMTKADGTAVGKYLGNELDFIATYNMNRFTAIELGYSIMDATGNMAFAKGQASTDIQASTFKRSGTWFYTMFRFTPDFFYTKSAKQSKG